MQVQYFTDVPAFAKLPAYLHLLAEKIEEQADQRVAVEQRAETNKMGCRMSKGEAVILAPDLGSFRKESVLHELLHLKRYFIDGVPRLVYCDDDHEFEDERDSKTSEKFQQLDNQIEHLFIVPQELARYRARRSYWEKLMGGLLELNLAHVDVLLASEFIHRVMNGGALSGKVQPLIETLNLGVACARFHRAVEESKEAATRCLFEFAPAKLPRACLDYFGQLQEVPLANVALSC